MGADKNKIPEAIESLRLPLAVSPHDELRIDDAQGEEVAHCVSARSARAIVTLANAAHSAREDGGKTEKSIAMFESVIMTGQTALKSAMLINGGASIALLTFLGQFIARPVMGGIAPFPEALAYFVGGVLAAAVAQGATHVSQRGYARKKWWGPLFTALAILFVVGAYSCFGWGSRLAYSGFSVLGTEATTR